MSGHAGQSRPLLPATDAVNVQRSPPSDGEEPEGKGGGATWIGSANIIVANMLGAGVLGLPAACAGMGWIGAIVVILLLTSFSIYGGLLLGILKGGDHTIDTYPELARRAAKSIGPGTAKFWARFCRVIGSIYMLGSCTIYLVTCKISLMLVFQKTQPPGHGPAVPAECVTTGSSNDGIANLSQNVWLVVVAGILYPLIHIRSLADATVVALVGVVTIAIVNVVIIANSISEAASGSPNGTAHNGSASLLALGGYDAADPLAWSAVAARPHTQAGPESLMQFINGMTQLAFAYGGHVLMVDIQASMAKPSDWPKSVYASQIFMFLNYCIVGFLGYYIYGDKVKAPITEEMADNNLRTFTNILLFVHVAVAYCINSCVLTTSICRLIWPLMSLDGSAGRGTMLRWGGVATFIMGLCLVIAVVVPFFGDLMNVYSSLGIFSLSFAVPVLLIMMVRRAEMGLASKTIHGVLVLAAVVGCGLGMWGAVKDIVDKWQVCDYHI